MKLMKIILPLFQRQLHSSIGKLISLDLTKFELFRYHINGFNKAQSTLDARFAMETVHMCEGVHTNRRLIILIIYF